MKNKKLQLVVSALISIVVAGFIVVITIRLIVSFELAMLNRLIIPIAIVFFPTWGFVHYGMFKRKRK
jgi:hypothetical protein